MRIRRHPPCLSSGTRWASIIDPVPGRVFDVTVLQPVEKQTLATVVMQRLVAYIQGDSLRPGDVLPSQHELAR